MTNDTYDSRAAAVLHSTVHIEVPGRHISRFIPNNRTLWAYIHRIPRSLKMICNTCSLKSWIKTHPLLEEIITSSNKAFIDFESEILIGIWKLSNWIWEIVKSNVLLKQRAGSKILTRELQARKRQTCEALLANFWGCIEQHIQMTDRWWLNLGTMQCSMVLCSILSRHKNC